MLASIDYDPPSGPLDFAYRARSQEFSLIEAIPARKVDQKKRFVGGLVDGDGNEISIARLVRGPSSSRQKIVCLDGLDLTGRAIPRPKAFGAFYFLGGLSWHYGHFLLEGLSRAPLSQAERMGFSFFYLDLTNGKEARHIKFFLKALGISAFPVTSNLLIDGLVRIPESRFVIRSHVDKSQIIIYKQIVEYVNNFIVSSGYGDLVYLSRARLRQDKRRISNEVSLESNLVRLGFSVVHMQELSVPEQIKVVSQARVVVGPLGTAMHNIVFANDDCAVIYISHDGQVNHNFYLVDAITGRLSHYLFAPLVNKWDGPIAIDADAVVEFVKSFI